MDSLNPEEFNNRISLFEPNRGDHLMKLKNSPPDNDIYIWRVVFTDKKIRKVWPGESSAECDHSDLYWAIDFNKRFITLCNECQEYAFGHEVEK